MVKTTMLIQVLGGITGRLIILNSTAHTWVPPSSRALCSVSFLVRRLQRSLAANLVRRTRQGGSPSSGLQSSDSVDRVSDQPNQDPLRSPEPDLLHRDRRRGLAGYERQNLDLESIII